MLCDAITELHGGQAVDVVKRVGPDALQRFFPSIDRHPFQLLAEVNVLAIKEVGTRVNDIVR